MKRILFFFAIGIVLTLMGCNPTVRLDTPEPVKIDVNMNVHVLSDQKNPPKLPEGVASSPQEARRYRMKEIQQLKNDRRIGEGNDGLLHIIKKPKDQAYAQYAEKLVREENADRVALFKDQSEHEKKPISDISKAFAERAKNSSFPGEWVQTPSGAWVAR